MLSILYGGVPAPAGARQDKFAHYAIDYKVVRLTLSTARLQDAPQELPHLRRVYGIEPVELA